MSMKTESLESELYRGRFDDGLLDLCCGIGLLGIGLLWLSEHPALTGVVPALLIPLWMALRKSITEPRMGRVEFSERRRRTERAGLGSALVVGIGALIVAVTAFLWHRRGGQPAEAWQGLVPLIPGLLVGLGLVVVSLMIGARRFLGYALALLGLAASTTWLGGDPGVYLALSGGVLCLWAGVVVARFMASHPDLDGK
jgi:hypothetical protein